MLQSQSARTHWNAYEPDYRNINQHSVNPQICYVYKRRARMAQIIYARSGYANFSICCLFVWGSYWVDS